MKRILYAPYRTYTATYYMHKIMAMLCRDNYDGSHDGYIKALIPWMHGEAGALDPEKGIILIGGTGVGKTTLVNAMALYMSIDDVKAIHLNRVVDIVPKIITARKMAVEVAENIVKVDTFTQRIGCLAIDDIGTEAQVNHYGNVVDTVAYVIEERYASNLITILTTNLGIDDIRKRYGDRVISRLVECYNIIDVNGSDKRLSV